MKLTGKPKVVVIIAAVIICVIGTFSYKRAIRDQVDGEGIMEIATLIETHITKSNNKLK